MGKFLIKKTEMGIVFHLRAANGETIGVSQVYESEEACKKGIESVMKVAPTAGVEDQTRSRSKELKNPKFEIYKDKGGKFRFRLKAHNGQEVLASQGYTAKASCKNGIQSIIANAPSSPIIEPDKTK
ncbi:MAG: YegP family protein [Clostridium sp.]